jgi:hypothetical protein
MTNFRNRLGGALVFADSGAFTAHSVGKPVSIEKYAKWLWKWHDVFNVSVNLDVIGSAQGSHKNLNILRGYGLNPLPVFHSGADIDDIKREVDNGATYIALGGLVVRQDHDRMIRWIDSVFNAIPESVNVHGFGFTKMDYMLKWNWKSVDSSTWVAGARFNRIILFDNGNFVSCNLSDPRKRHEHSRLIGEHYPDVELFTSGRFHYKHTFILGAVAMYRASEYWAAQSKRKGWKDPVVYLASTEAPLIHARRAIREYQRTT